MSNLTQEHFDEQLKKLATKKDLEQQTEELAKIVNDSFDDVQKQLHAIVKLTTATHEIVEKYLVQEIRDLKFRVRELEEAQKMS